MKAQQPGFFFLGSFKGKLQERSSILGSKFSFKTHPHTRTGQPSPRQLAERRGGFVEGFEGPLRLRALTCTAGIPGFGCVPGDGDDGEKRKRLKSMERVKLNYPKRTF